MEFCSKQSKMGRSFAGLQLSSCTIHHLRGPRSAGSWSSPSGCLWNLPSCGEIHGWSDVVRDVYDDACSPIKKAQLLVSHDRPPPLHGPYDSQIGVVFDQRPGSDSPLSRAACCPLSCGKACQVDSPSPSCGGDFESSPGDGVVPEPSMQVASTVTAAGTALSTEISTSASTTLEDLPGDVVCRILAFLSSDLKSFMSASLTCRSWLHTSREAATWTNLTVVCIPEPYALINDNPCTFCAALTRFMVDRASLIRQLTIKDTGRHHRAPILSRDVQALLRNCERLEKLRLVHVEGWSQEEYLDCLRMAARSCPELRMLEINPITMPRDMSFPRLSHLSVRDLFRGRFFFGDKRHVVDQEACDTIGCFIERHKELEVVELSVQSISLCQLDLRSESLRRISLYRSRNLFVRSMSCPRLDVFEANEIWLPHQRIAKAMRWMVKSARPGIAVSMHMY